MDCKKYAFSPANVIGVTNADRDDAQKYEGG